LVLIDSLTNLKNRNALLIDSENENEVNTLFLVDILFFKDINELHGVVIGDKVIKYLTNILSEKVKKVENKTSNLYRLFSNTLGIFFEKDLEVSKIKNLIHEIIYDIHSKEFFIEEEIKLDIAITIGVAKGTDKKIISNAENVLLIAKQNHLEYAFDLNKNVSSKNNILLLSKLRKIIKNNEVIPYYQPIYNNFSGEIEKYEALMRVNCNNIILTPIEFLNFSKKARVYGYLMEKMLDRVFEDIIKYKINVNINVSFKDLNNHYFLESLIEKIKEKKIGDYLTIEILEDEEIIDFEKMDGFIRQLKLLGVKIAIDDFGSGFSSLEQVLKLDIDLLKIDGSLIKNIQAKRYRRMLELIVDFSNEMNIEMVAEYVSSEEIQEKVTELKIKYSQGYLISKPLPILEVLNLKKENYGF
jgi:diguanylate cyclase (GGDEF)-like protein